MRKKLVIFKNLDASGHNHDPYTGEFTSNSGRPVESGEDDPNKTDNTLYRAKNSTYSKQGNNCGFHWWTPDQEWAEGYGDDLIARDDADKLKILDLPLDALEARERLGTYLPEWNPEDDGINFDMFRDDDLDTEIQQVLSHKEYGPKIARALRAAGYHGVSHPDYVDIRGTGEAVALLREDLE